MGVVYAARDFQSDQEVAIKVLAKARQHGKNIERFEREARLATSIDHPNIIKTLDFGALHDGRPFLVLERLHGETIESWMSRNGPLPFGNVKGVAQYLFPAVIAAHDQGVVHRDIKPDNLFLFRTDQRTRLKLIDFGLSKSLVTPERLTDDGVAVGTPAYMAPEQALGKPIDQRTDVYGIGLTFYALLTGSCPFDIKGANIATILASVIADYPPRIDERVPEVPKAIGDVIHRSIAKGADRRYPDIAALRDAWNKAL